MNIRRRCDDPSGAVHGRRRLQGVLVALAFLGPVCAVSTVGTAAATPAPLGGFRLAAVSGRVGVVVDIQQLAPCPPPASGYTGYVFAHMTDSLGRQYDWGEGNASLDAKGNWARSLGYANLFQPTDLHMTTTAEPDLPAASLDAVPGTYTIAVSCAQYRITSDNRVADYTVTGTYDSQQYTVLNTPAPTLHASPNTVSPGQAVTVTPADSCAPFGPHALMYGGWQNGTVLYKTMGAQGSWNITTTVPIGTPPGTYYIHAACGDFGSQVLLGTKEFPDVGPAIAYEPLAIKVGAPPLRADPGTLAAFHTSQLVASGFTPNTLVSFQVTAGPDKGFAAVIRSDAAGLAQTKITGNKGGSDTVIAWIDSNIDAQVDNGESAATTQLVWLPNRYVALGDSVPYGHGLANPAMTSQTGLPANEPPSSAAYPSLLQKYLGAHSTLRDTACSLGGDNLTVSGAPASSDNAASDYKNCGLATSRHPAVEPDEVTGADLVNNPPSLVTIQAGADDFNFAGCLTKVLTLATGKVCVKGKKVTNTVAGEMSAASAAIERSIADIKSANPTATVYVLNYYQPIPPPEQAKKDGTLVCNALVHRRTQTYKAAQILQTKLNELIAGAVANAQTKYNGVTLVDVSNAMSEGTVSHGMCTDSPWIFGGDATSWGVSGAKWRVAHPTADGQKALLSAVLSQSGLKQNSML